VNGFFTRTAAGVTADGRGLEVDNGELDLYKTTGWELI
jgi:hypothetical protein